MNSYNVKIDAFEGPLDLLLHLIQQAEVDIYNIPVSEITEQYLLYVQTMQELELDVASEYLVMAATLLAIKSQMLLPKQEEMIDEELTEDWEEDPREELMSQLLEYKRFKEAAGTLKNREEQRNLTFSKPPSTIDNSQTLEEDNEIDTKHLSLYDMIQAFQKLKERVRYKKPRQTKIRSEEIPLTQRMDEIRTLLSRQKEPTTFSKLFDSPDKSHMVVTFLAVLELMKAHSISCMQMDNFEDIIIISREGEIQDE
ncbi:segregation/condensation protein A [Bacillus sp. FJAT-44742]|uniref:segregation/condensation protein A n=1 Tax=Bacillus sp. FJAT-44742 TaxID=2014005 RepID=UPI000C23C31A|nr:segregation/condensation protein A [Bacillus sp. FJAT-44742]